MLKKRQLVSNSAALLANRLAQTVTSFVLIAFIARTLGAYVLGQYLLAFTYYFVFMTLVAAGLKSLLTRELSRNLSEASKYLVNGILIQLIFSIIGYLGLTTLVFLLPYSQDTATACYIMGLAILPFSLSNITEAVFQAAEKMHLIAMSTVPVHLARLLVAIEAIRLGYNINTIAAIFVVSESLILLIEWLWVKRLTQIHWQIDPDFIWQTIKSSRSFLAIDGIATINARMQVLILSILGGETVVGLYGTVDQLMQPFHLVAYSLVLAIFPSLSKASETGKENQRRLAESTIELLLLIALPLTIGLFFVGQDLLVFLYGNAHFAEAALALSIVALTLVLTAFIRPLSYLLVASGFERVNLREVVITTILGGLCSIALVPEYKLTGAAVSALIMSISSLAQYIYAVYHRCFPLQIRQIFFRPLLVSLGVTVTFLVLKQTQQGFLFTAVAATSIYTLLMMIIGIYILGGPIAAFAKLFNKQFKT